MKYLWFNQNKNKNLIILFNGWAMNESVFKKFSNDNFDILILYDYKNTDFDFSVFDFTNYNKKYLICWSMGVYVSGCLKKELETIGFDKKIAINGTNKMIDNNYGIPKRVFDITIKSLNEENLNKFILNVFEKIPVDFKISKNIEELKNELIFIKNLSLKDEISFDKAIISLNDKIVPAKNQLNFWHGKTNIQKINASHSPFEYYKSWGDIIC